MTEGWPVTVTRIVVLLGLNLVPIWGFAEEQWSPGTTLALYWVQSAFSIPITAVLVLMHRRATHKQGHYDPTSMMSGDRTVAAGGGRPALGKRTEFLSAFLVVSIPFLIVHGVFLAFMLGVVWKDAAGGVDLEDLRTGAVAMLNMMALGFAVDVFRLNERPFAWIRHRSETLMQRTLVVQMAIILGMGVAAFAKNDAGAFFGVFLALKLLADLCSELPPWMPKEKPPRFYVWLYQRFGDGKTDIYADWRGWRANMIAAFEADERVVEPVDLERR